MILGRLRALIKRLVWKDDVMVDDTKFDELFTWDTESEEAMEAAEAEREEEIV